MVEVFKTNVMSHDQANMLLAQLQNVFPDYKINFDLEDCDRILRVESKNSIITDWVIDLIQTQGYEVEILPDDIPGIYSTQFHSHAQAG
jgi:hypothetical protein